MANHYLFKRLKDWTNNQFRSNLGATGYLAYTCRLHATPAAPGAASVLAATALTAAVQTVTAGITQPGVPRNLVVTGGQAGQNHTVTVNGTNAAGQVISEDFVLNGTTAVTGLKAFKSVTSVVLPVQNAGGDTVEVGTGSALGLANRLTQNTVQAAFHNNVKEGTAPTVTVDAVNLEKNTVTLATALDGAAVDVYYWV